MKVGILGAMSVEIKMICELMEIKLIKTIAGIEFQAGQLNGASVIVAKCGIGKVNSAICAQIMIDHFDIDCIINVGIAGSLNNDLNICDIVISKDLIQHDFDTSLAGDEIGLITGFSTVEFTASEKLVQVAKSIAYEKFPEGKVHVGRIATGDQFIGDVNLKNRIVSNFKPLCVEMEGASIAQACLLNNMPFIVIRSISDKADNSASLDFFEFEKQAAENSSIFLVEFVNKLKDL